MTTINERIKKKINEKYSNSFLESHDYQILAVRLNEDGEIIEIKCAISGDTFVPTEWLLVNKEGDFLSPEQYLENPNFSKFFTVRYALGNDILLELWQNNTRKELCHYRYNEKNKLEPVHNFKLQRWDNEEYITYPTLKVVSENPKIGILHYNKENSDKGINYIYLFDEGKISSPGFTSLKLLRDDNLDPFFEFTDNIESSIALEIEEEKKKIETTLRGFIRPNGTMHESVYDEYFNLERACSFNNYPDFEEYKRLKEYISHKLDKRVQEENERALARKTNLKAFKEKAKTLNYGKKN